MKICLAQTHSEVCGAMQELRSFEKESLPFEEPKSHDILKRL